uniref:Swan n=1 Tax=Phallusia mammillata TaxID=59560 RepID=A0A6F9DRD6_9ASCI|nr:swan [Phallusia mammillata]
MATGVVIRLRNLPLVAGTIDIRQFFGGLRIPDGGVHIIGGEEGTAFILFSTDEDARQAMMRDGQTITGMPIKLMLSSHSEMKSVIEDSQRVCEELRGLRPPEPPITNLSSHSSAVGRAEYPPQQQIRQFHAKPPSPELMPSLPTGNDMHLEIKGMPFDVDESAIMYFFAPIPLIGIRFMVDEAGRRTGDALVKFKSPMDLYQAMKKDRTYFGNRYIKLNPIADRQPQLPPAPMYDPLRAVDRKRPLSPSEGTPKRSREFSPLRSDNCVEIRGLPSTANFKSVGEFFTRLRFADGGLYVETDGKVCKGRAFVEFLAYADFKEALLKDGDMLNGKQVRVISLSKQNMLEQIRIHKKHMKTKREEEFMREKEKKLQEKKIKEERKREHQLRKQKEMDEWLRRQHQKEEEERKRRDIEKQMLLKSMEDQRMYDIHHQQQLEQKRQAELQHLENSKTDSSSLAVQATIKKEETVSGAGEMEIEEVEQTLPTTSTPASMSLPQPPVFGASGGIVGAAAMPFVVPGAGFPLPPMPQIPGVLPPSLPPNLNPSDFMPPNMANLPPPPLPTASALPPPPTPPVMENKADIATTINSVSASGEPPKPTESKETNGDAVAPVEEVKNELEDSVYIRMANTPFQIAEDDIKRFFSDVSIAPNGIQFIMKKGMRSGHVFIKCTSVNDAKRAVVKNDEPLLGRNVLVQASNMDKFQEIYFRLTKGNYTPTFDKSSSAPTLGDSVTKRIKSDNLTCICVGNLPWDTNVGDMFNLFRDLKIIRESLVIMRGLDRKCTGEAYMELDSAMECVKAANLHNILAIRGNSIRVLPLSRNNMRKDIENHDKRMNAEITRHVSDPHRSMGPPPRGPPNLPPPNEAQMSRMPPMSTRPESSLPPYRDERMHHPRDVPPGMPPRDLPPMFGPRDIPPDAGRYPPIPLPPGLMKDGLPPPLPFGDGRMPPPGHPDSFMRPRSPPTPEELLRLRGPGGPPFYFSPPPVGAGPPRFPMGGPPLPPNPAKFVSVKMGNLNFKVTQEDIVEFFWSFDPIPDSVRLMYNKSGKPTGDGLISFPNIDAARAAIDQLKGKNLRQRPIKLFLQ